MVLGDARALVSVVEVCSDEAEQQLECIRADGTAEKIPFYLSKKIVEGVGEV